MIKKISILLLFILLFSFAISQEEPSLQTEKDAQELQEAIDKYIPLDEGGKLDIDSYKPIKSNAEEKIGEINSWLAENATWLKVVFGMVPAITLLFFSNLYVMIFLFTTIFLNANSIFGYIPRMDEKIEFLPLNITWARLLGLMIFIMLLATKVILMIAKIISDMLYFLWNDAWEVATPIAVIIFILAVIALIVVAIYCPQLLQTLNKIRIAKKEQNAKGKQDLNRQALETIVKTITDSK